MDIRISAVIFALCSSPGIRAQEEQAAQTQLQTLPEEVVVTGERSIWKLRTEMIDAERDAYDIFNKFNDEERFMISCNLHQPTGTRIETQVCQAEFELVATRAHGSDYFENLRELLNVMARCSSCLPNYSPPVMHSPTEATIASQQDAYRGKLKQVAEEHPEFLEAIIRYSDMREQYQEATRTTLRE